MSEVQEVRSFRDLIVWQRSIQVCVAIYGLTRGFPAEEQYGLKSQLRRAAVSISSNIAEGSGRRSTGEFIQFLGMARGSNYEVQTQLVLAEEMRFGDEAHRHQCNALTLEVEKMLNSLMLSLERKKRST